MLQTLEADRLQASAAVDPIPSFFPVGVLDAQKLGTLISGVNALIQANPPEV